nr:hypothetical protein [Tanacetum cinerariifolium]
IFWVAGANNDLTFLNHSSLFDDMLNDIASIFPYEVNKVTFEKGYYLADGIYPQWETFVKSFTGARGEKNVVFKRRQESARKKVVSDFGVLQGVTTPPTSPHPFFDTLEDLPPRTTNPPPPKPMFDFVERLASHPLPVPDVIKMEPPLPPLSPQLSPFSQPMWSNDLLPPLTHETFCEHCQ